MSSDHETSERIYVKLKQDILGGTFGVAGQLNIAWLARQYDSSTTPVREGLLRLVGEQLVEFPASGGFDLAILSDNALADLYDLNRGLMLLAINWTRPGATASRDPTATIPSDAAGLFAAVARTTGNDAFHRCICRLNEQLRPARRAEASLFPNLAEELGALIKAVCQIERKSARSRLNAYHARRLRHMAEINQARRGLEAERGSTS